MYNASRDFIVLSFEEHIQQKNTRTHPTTTLPDHPLQPITTLEYAQQYTMPKELGAQPRRGHYTTILPTILSEWSTSSEAQDLLAAMTRTRKLTYKLPWSRHIQHHLHQLQMMRYTFYQYNNYVHISIQYTFLPRMRKISNSPLKPAHNGHKNSGCCRSGRQLP